jgi:hypothetical protein
MINLPQLACREKPYQSTLSFLVCPLCAFLVCGLFRTALVAHDALAFRVARFRGLIVMRLVPDAIFPGHVLIPLRPRETTLKPAGKFPPRDKKSGCNGRNGGPAVPFVDQPKMRTSAMTARRYRDRGARRPREIMHRRSRAFDDPGADEFDEWMAACQPADTSQPSS